MILGDVCTRACAYCAVTHGRPGAARLRTSRRRVADADRRRSASTTSSSRRSIATTCRTAARRSSPRRSARRARGVPDCRIEVLIPDFQGDEAPLRTVLDARPDVLNHNIETVPRLYRMARSGGRYARTLELLDRSRTLRARHSDQDRPDGRPRRRARRARRDLQGSSRRRLRDSDDRPVPAAVAGARADGRATTIPTNSASSNGSRSTWASSTSSRVRWCAARITRTKRRRDAWQAAADAVAASHLPQ